MTDTNANRKKLVKDLRRKLGHMGQTFPYDRILAGDWEVVVKEIGKILQQPAWELRHKCGRFFVRLAKHARGCSEEESLMLPLLLALNGDTRRLEYKDETEAFRALMEVTRALNQQEVDELVRGIVKYSFLRRVKALAECGYAPSIDVEKELLVLYKISEVHLLEIRRMQPRWHAMRLHAEMRDLTAGNASRQLRTGPGL